MPMDDAAWTLELFWGMDYPKSMGNVACREIPGFFRRLWTIMWSHGQGFRVDCAFTPTVSVTSLRGETTAKLLEDFEGKVVFYGASFLAGSDIIFPPTHFSLPGVYSHAMALDNLLTFGTSYKRDATDNPLWLVPRWAKPLVHHLVSALDHLVGYPEWFPGQSHLRSLVRCFGDELTPHCLQYGLLALVLLYLHVMSSLAAGYLDPRRLSAVRPRSRRTLLAAVSAAWTIIVMIIGPAILILWFTLKIQFEGLNLTAGNWLEALLEAWAGHHWGPPLLGFVGTLFTSAPASES